MTATLERRITSGELAHEIRARYEPPEWHVQGEVTLAGRRLDLVAFNLWAARRYRIVGFEIKVSRGDWLRELGAFQKSEEWAAVVDAFYVVTPPKLVCDGELPDGWGLLELSGSRLMTRRHATEREGRLTIPREVSARFIGALAGRQSQDELTAKLRADDALRAEARANAERRVADQLADAARRADEAERELHELYRALAVEPRAWRAHESAMRAAGIFANATTVGRDLTDSLEISASKLEVTACHIREALTEITKANQ